MLVNTWLSEYILKVNMEALQISENNVFPLPVRVCVNVCVYVCVSGWVCRS